MNTAAYQASAGRKQKKERQGENEERAATEMFARSRSLSVCCAMCGLEAFVRDISQVYIRRTRPTAKVSTVTHTHDTQKKKYI